MTEDQIAYYLEIGFILVALWVGINGVFFTQRTIDWNKRAFVKMSRYLPMHKNAVAEYDKPYIYGFTKMLSGFFLAVGIFKALELLFGFEVQTESLTGNEIQAVLFYLVFFGGGCFGVYQGLKEDRVFLKIFSIILGLFFIVTGLNRVFWILTGGPLFPFVF